MLSIRTLLGGILDYAGLFPPAKLDMPAAVRSYAGLVGGADAWLAGRFVLPVARFAEFESAAESLLPKVESGPEDEAWTISAITAAAADPEFARDLDAIEAFNERHAKPGAGSALIDSIEVRVATAAEVDRALDLVPNELHPYFECPAGADPRGFVAAMAGLDAGAKIRTGGLTAEAHPSTGEVARFLLACALAEVPFKATAGLHHPLRHHAPDVGCPQHGFLNLFVGASFAFHRKVDEATLARLLADESEAGFRFADDGVAWGDLRLTVGEIRAARERFAHSFGSCSFDEPLADLRSLGLLRAEAATR